ncbi:MAG: pyridoxine 5'-phosphate synthase [Vampirovibrionales bacterium]|nr:pyridoxine 5'-phosphate synthase [Vampirovibrionales bacterium]
MTPPLLLGVNIDHVATLRNVRGTLYPSPLKAAQLAEDSGADGITVHLREDRRHIRDEDVIALRQSITTHLNLEMANTPEMVAFALKVKPDYVTLVPERREELTTEGGLDVVRYQTALQPSVTALQAAGIPVSLFIESNPAQVAATASLGAKIVEFHTGRYCDQHMAGENTQAELDRLFLAAHQACALGLVVNAGHGLTCENIGPILTLPGLNELNIGHSLISDALFVGLGGAIGRMKQAMTYP